MTQIIHPEICDGCGADADVVEVEGNELCESCRGIADALTKDPSKVARIIKLSKLDISPESLFNQSGTGKAFTGLPEVLDAVRFRTRDRDMNKWYVSISEIDGQPVEIFASTAFDRVC